MTRNSRILVFLSAFVAVLIGVVAIAVFVIGTPWLADLNPYYALADWSDEDTTVTGVSAPGSTMPRTRGGIVLSAFFGVDGGLPPVLRFLFCPFAPGMDGMPVIFSHELDVASVQAGDFRVVTQAGRVGSVACTTFLPAADDGELRTVLLAGDFGSAADQPVSVEIAGNILSLDGSVNFKGERVGVVPLEDGPSLALAKNRAGIPSGASERRGDAAALGRRQRLSRQAPGMRFASPGKAASPGRAGATPMTSVLQALSRWCSPTPSDQRERAPTALADLGDGDNNHLLCFDVEGDPLEVRFPAGFLTDPRDDLNPETTAPVVR